MSDRTLRLLVCGGRDFDDVALMTKTLKPLEPIIAVVIHGGAKGADALAGEWAKLRDIAVACFEADWDAHGLAAGPRRNTAMLNQGNPNWVIAFPGGKGTANMISQACVAGIPVLSVRRL